MLSERRIREAERNLKNYVKEGLLSKVQFNPKIFNILRKNADESLEIANFLRENNKSSLWVITTAYYSRFYLANALLYNWRYKIGDRNSHKVTADSLIVLARNKIARNLLESYEELRDEALAMMKSDELIDSFDFERRKRGLIQYNTPEVIKLSKVETSLNRAREFMLEIENILDRDGNT